MKNLGPRKSKIFAQDGIAQTVTERPFITIGTMNVPKVKVLSRIPSENKLRESQIMM